MEQNRLPNQRTIDWLVDYTRYIRDRLAIPHNQAEGLLHQYLDLTARGPAQQLAVPSYQQPTSYPEPPNPHHQPFTWGQHQNPHLDPRLNNQPLSYSGSSNRHHEPFIMEQSQNPHLPMRILNQPLSNSGPSSQRHEPLIRGQPQDRHLATHQPMTHSAHFSRHHETYGGDETGDLFTPMATATPNEAPRPQFSHYDQNPSSNMTLDSGFSPAAGPSSSQTQTTNPAPVGTIEDYDPLWVQKENVDPVQVEEFKSAMNFETLLLQGAIKLDDVLIFQVSVTTNGREEETEAYLQFIETSRCLTTDRKLPDFSVNVLNAPGVLYPDAKACRGTTVMIDHLQACNIKVLKKGWADIEVIRGRQALGSLWWVKQAFHLWRDMKDEEARQTGQFFRRRRVHGRGFPDGTVQHNGSFGVWHDETFVPDPEQGRYRGRG